MDKDNYLRYLIKTFKLPENTDECSLFGFFQDFRTNLRELKKVFTEIPNGDSFLNRLLPVFDSIPEPEGKKLICILL